MGKLYEMARGHQTRDRPRGNQKDLRDLPEDVRNEMEFVFAERVRDVLAAMLPGLVPEPAPRGASDAPAKAV